MSAEFTYDGEIVHVEQFDSNHGEGVGFECPACGTWAIVMDHDVPFHVKRGGLSLDAAIRCRNKDCGWTARIEDGVATEVEVEADA